MLAVQMGKLKRGGVPDREKAARTVLTDWNSGKIKYFTHPPEAAESNLGAEIVAQFAAEFSLDKLDQTEEMDTLPSLKPSDIVQVENQGLRCYLIKNNLLFFFNLFFCSPLILF